MNPINRLQIRLADVPTRLSLGVTAAERAEPQAIRVGVAVEIARVPQGDDLGETIDYDALIGFIRDELPARAPLRLIETVAALVAEAALALSPAIERVEVEVAKPRVLEGVGGMVSVRLTRERSAR